MHYTGAFKNVKEKSQETAKLGAPTLVINQQAYQGKGYGPWLCSPRNANLSVRPEWNRLLRTHFHSPNGQ